jgi:Circularly permutated YpsA SLOG family
MELVIIVHGGQSGVDRGAHEAAIECGWPLSGYMTRDARDESGPIPPEVAQFLRPHETMGYAERTDANVRASNAVLIVVRDARYAKSTPGTRRTIALAEKLRKPKMIVDPKTPADEIARWIWSELVARRTLPLPIATIAPEPEVRLMVAGPRESKWASGRVETYGLLRHVGRCLSELRLRD